MKEVALKNALNRVLLITTGFVAVLAFCLLFSYSEIKQALEQKNIQEELVKTADRQIEQLLPSFLMQEQREGLPVLLERFKSSDGLTQIQFIENDQALPLPFKKCKLGNEPHLCESEDNSLLAVLIPIKMGDRHFGHLLKVKEFKNTLAQDQVLHMIEFGSAIVILMSIALFLLISKVTSKQIPDDLENLVSWLGLVIDGKTSERAPTLRFQELNALGAKIGELLDRHEKSRDRAMIGLITSGIMHDIKTPMQSLVSARDLISEEEPGTPARLENLESLFNKCTKKLPLIGAIIETTLDANREIHVEPKATDLGDTINDAVAGLSAIISKKKIRLEGISELTSKVIDHDSVQLGRVFSNLLKNSIEALGETGNQRDGAHADISIRVDESQSGHTRVIFEDAGPGLPEDAENVFRLIRGTKARSSGLGLVISRKIVQSHHGTLKADHGEFLPGARFEIVLPNIFDSQGFSPQGDAL